MLGAIMIVRWTVEQEISAAVASEIVRSSAVALRFLAKQFVRMVVQVSGAPQDQAGRSQFANGLRQRAIWLRT
jgi:hypothetical protein